MSWWFSAQIIELFSNQLRKCVGDLCAMDVREKFFCPDVFTITLSWVYLNAHTVYAQGTWLNKEIYDLVAVSW